MIGSMERPRAVDRFLDNLVAGTLGLSLTTASLAAVLHLFGAATDDLAPGWLRMLERIVAGSSGEVSVGISWLLALGCVLALPIMLREGASGEQRISYWRVVCALVGTMMGSVTGLPIAWGIVGAGLGWCLGGLAARFTLMRNPLLRTMGRSLLVVLPAIAVLAPLAREEAVISRPARVIVICVDTLRPDHLSAYGYRRATTPVLDALVAEEGILFENAYAPSSWTLPSVASLFTSMDPPQHGVEDRGRRLGRSVPTLAGAFSGAGWLTAAQVTHIYVSSLFGLDSGFLEFREHSIDWNFGEGLQLRADDLNRFVLPWLAHHSRDRFFLYLHYFDPHWDYAAPPPFGSRFTDPAYSGPANGSWRYLREYLPRDRLMPPAELAQVVAHYDGEIAWTDFQLGVVFDALKSWNLWDDTLLVVTSDHGEEFQEHGSVHHIRTLYEEVLRVPLILKLPGGRPAGVRSTVPERVRLIDLAPTLGELAGVPVPEGFRGESLVPLLRDEGPDRPVFAHTVRHSSDTMCLIEGREKLIWVYTQGAESIELYDLAADPGETRSLAETAPDRAAELRARAAGWFERVSALRGDDAAPVVLTDRQEEHLKALGYAE
jgi:arylsulfatase A-like enzyme